MAYRLAETSFNDLKNYDAAATQFANAIAGNPNAPYLADALYLRARSLEFLAWRIPRTNNPLLRHTVRSSSSRH